MIRVRQIIIDINNNTKESIIKKICKKLSINKESIKDYKINKKSIDARRKPNINYIYEIDVEVDKEESILKKNKTKDILKTPDEEYKFIKTGNIKLNKNITIVGSGPGGLLSAYILSENGYKVTVIERGEKIEDRVRTVEEFWKTGKLNEESNVQFGEGGAGTFSDGKLNTLIKNNTFRQKKLFEIFIECGAPEEIAYINNPHIGTDLLRNVIINMRNKIIEMGGEFLYNTRLTDLIIKNNEIKQIEINNNKLIDTEVLILAIGHSARDTFDMLYKNKLNIQSKPFAIGLRIEHPQEMINESQYGKEYSGLLPQASYKLTHKTTSGRGVYTFCMCPGGYVVNSSSENKLLAINGMSNYKRDTENANSAIIVTIDSKDYGEHPLDGIKYQKMLEEKAYNLGGGLIPIQLYGDFKTNQESVEFGKIKPIFKGNYKFVDLNKILPEYIKTSIIEGIESFSKKIPNYNRDDAILAGIETRTSSPIRIIRNEEYESNIKGIYPCGEGAGYAGGITSSAIDGIKIAEIIGKKYY